MGSRAGLAAIEAIIDASGVAGRIEALLPAGVRHRQLRTRTLLTGMMLALDDRRPAHLTEARAALTSLPEADQVRLGVIEDWHGRPHQLTYRQAEHTCRLIAKALGKDSPDGAPTDDLQAFCDQLLEASIPAAHKNSSLALAADWTDVETWSRPPRHGSTICADREASWGHRNSNLPGPKGEMFFGYFLSAAAMVAEENGPPVPELTRRITVADCHHDPVRQLAAVLLRMAAGGIPLGDVIDDSGYAHRDADAWAVPLRQAGAQLVQDLHPHDRGPKGTHHGAVIANGNLYCPQTPRTLLELAPLPPGASGEQVTGRGLDRRRVLVPPAAPWHQRLRQPRSALGAPHRQPAGPQRRAVLRLVPVDRRHGPRRERPARPRTGPPHDPHQLPAGPGPRPRPGPAPHAQGGHPPWRHHR